MYFTSPIWFIGLIPWGIAVVWLLRGRGTPAAVSFLHLWKGPAFGAPPRKAMQAPPAAIVAAMVASFLAIAAAAGPYLSVQRGAPGRISIIVDRGLSMSASNGRGELRFVEAAHMLDAAIRERSFDGGVDLRIVPGKWYERVAVGRWLAVVETQPATGVSQLDDLANAVRGALANTNGPVFVISDWNLNIADPRLVQIAPTSLLANVGIESFSARISPHPSAMVRVLNQSPLDSAMLSIRSDGVTSSQKIELPPMGQSRNYFVDLPGAGKVLEVEIQANDNPAPDHRAWLVQQSAWPRIQARSALPAEVARMVEVYTRLRPPTESSRKISLVTSFDQIPPDEPAAIVVKQNPPARELSGAQVIVAKDSTLDLSHIDWAKILEGASAFKLPPGDWAPVVSAAGEAVVALRTAPGKQVWVGFDSPRLASTSDFVALWSAIFNWLGNGVPLYDAVKAGSLDGVWHLIHPAGVSVSAEDLGLTPGLYQGDSGRLRAVNAGAVAFSPASTIDWRPKLDAMLRQSNYEPRSLAAPLLLIALSLLCLAVICWPGGRRREWLKSPIQDSFRQQPF
ncbi:MAG: hypothetical protein M3O30_05000 [Planctomycetota bacterium]|nr:hypothetical protein [Planctomycetota bacterium]